MTASVQIPIVRSHNWTLARDIVVSGGGADPTHIYLNRKAPNIIPTIGLIVLEPGTVNCEVIVPLSVSGNVVTTQHPMLFNHGSGINIMYELNNMFFIDWFGSDPLGVADSGPAFRRCLDAGGVGKAIRWTPGGIYLLNTTTFQDSTSVDIITTHHCHGTKFILGSGLLQIKEWNDFCTANGYTANAGAKWAFIDNTDRNAPLDGSGAVIVNGHDMAGAGAKLKPRTLWQSPTISSSVAAPGTAFAFTNKHSMLVKDGRATGIIAGIGFDGYSDDIGWEGGFFGNGPTGTKAKSVWFTDNGDSARVKHVVGNGSGAYFGKCHGFLYEGGISGNITVAPGAHAGDIRDHHYEADGASEEALTILGGSFEAANCNYNPPNDTDGPLAAVEINHADITSPDWQSEVTLKKFWWKTNVKAGDVNDPKAKPHIHITRMHPNAKLKIVGMQPTITTNTSEEAAWGLWVAATDINIQAALDNAYGLLAFDYIIKQRNGQWVVLPDHNAPIECKKKVPPTITSITSDSVNGKGNLSLGTWHAYCFMVYDELGNLSAYSGPIADQAVTGKLGMRITLAMLTAGLLVITHGMSNDVVTAATPVAAGTGYAVNDILTVQDGTGTSITPAQLKVITVSGGAIMAVSIQTPGNYTARPTNPVTVTGGSGTGATFTLAWGGAALAQAAALNTPDWYFTSPCNTGTLRFYHTGNQVNKQPVKTPVPAGLVPSTGGATDHTQSAVKLDNGTIILASNGGIQGRRVQRVQTLVNAATVTPDSDNYDIGQLDELSQTTAFANPTGTPTNGQTLELFITTTAQQILNWTGTKYRNTLTASFPTLTTGSGKLDRVIMQYKSNVDRWDCIGVVMGA